MHTKHAYSNKLWLPNASMQNVAFICTYSAAEQKNKTFDFNLALYA